MSKPASRRPRVSDQAVDPSTTSTLSTAFHFHRMWQTLFRLPYVAGILTKAIKRPFCRLFTGTSRCCPCMGPFCQPPFCCGHGERESATEILQGLSRTGLSVSCQSHFHRGGPVALLSAVYRFNLLVQTHSRHTKPGAWMTSLL